jgi:hypothetical protein
VSSATRLIGKLASPGSIEAESRTLPLHAVDCIARGWLDDFFQAEFHGGSTKRNNCVLTKRELEPESGIRKQPGRFHGGHAMLRPKSLSVKTGEPHGESGALQTGYAITFGSVSSHTGFAPGWATNAGPKPKKAKVQRLLRQLQAIRVGTLEIATQDPKRLLTQIPPELNALLARVGLVYSPNRQPGLRCSLKRQATLRFTRESVQNGGKLS